MGNVNKVILTESERNQVSLIVEEFNAKGGMSTKELISRLDAIPFEDFMTNISEKIRTYINGNVGKA